VLFDHDFESIFPVKVDSITIGGIGFPGALNLPSGTTAARTSAPVAGSFRWNTTLGALEVYNGAAWSSPFLLTSQAAGTILAAPAGAAGLPTFRLVALGEQSNVAITTPTASQVLTYNGTNWINSSVIGSNAAGLIGVGQAGAAAWTLVSGTRYTAAFAHNLGTTNVVVTVYDTSTNQIVLPDSVTTTDANTVTVVVVGNSKTLKVVVVANGQSIVAGGSTPSSVVVAYNGVTIGTTTTKINFSGTVTVTDAGSNTTNVVVTAAGNTVLGRFTFLANSLDTPNNADWAVNAFAPVVTDSVNAALNLRQYSNTIEQGVGTLLPIPTGSTSMTIRIKGKAGAAPVAASVVQFSLYLRNLPNNAAIGAWSAATQLNNITVPITTQYFQYFTQTITLATLGATAGNLYQFELTRRVAGVTGTNLAANFLLAETTFEFS
jgi:hypothetical protein